MKLLKFAATLATAAFSLTAAMAGPINSPVPTNAYIVQGDLDWAWAYPCPGISACGFGVPIDLTYQSTQGWRFPTLEEFLLHPSAQDFLFAGANVPAGGSDPISGAVFQAGPPNVDGACATPYFSPSFLHCDFGDGNANSWASSPEEQTLSEQLLVRSHRAAVPEPSTLAMIAVALLSLLTFGWVRRSPSI